MRAPSTAASDCTAQVRKFALTLAAILPDEVHAQEAEAQQAKVPNDEVASGEMVRQQYVMQQRAVQLTMDNSTQTACNVAQPAEIAGQWNAAQPCLFAEVDPRCDELTAPSQVHIDSSEVDIASGDDRSGQTQLCRLVSHSCDCEPSAPAAGTDGEVLFELAQSVACSIEPISAGLDSLTGLLALGLGIDLRHMAGSRTSTDASMPLTALLTVTAERCSDCLLQLHVLQTLTQSALLRLADAHARLNLKAASAAQLATNCDETSASELTELTSVRVHEAPVRTDKAVDVDGLDVATQRLVEAMSLPCPSPPHPSQHIHSGSPSRCLRTTADCAGW